MKIVLLGTINPYRGGLATFNERLAVELKNQGHEITVYNFSLQYPSFLFPGTSQYLDHPHSLSIRSIRIVNSINPLNWLYVGYKLYKESPDMIIFRYWISFMAPCYSVIASIAKLNKHTKIWTIVDNAISHEPKFYEKFVAKVFLNISNYLMCMSQKVADDLITLTDTKPLLVHHPLYDSYAAPMSKLDARKKLELDSDTKFVLFFGFIREYKGLDILLEAMKNLNIKRLGVRLIVAGEFYAHREKYLSLARNLQLGEQIIWHTDFIPDEEIATYFCAVDAVILPYKSATQSGVTQIAFNYHTPIIATNVGGIYEMVEHDKHGYIVPPTSEAISEAISNFYSNEVEQKFRNQIELDKSQYSWAKFVHNIVAAMKKR